VARRTGGLAAGAASPCVGPGFGLKIAAVWLLPRRKTVQNVDLARRAARPLDAA
jgi:hypothetical protein